MKYQDFVIKDGKFIGKFEEMYKQFDDPWEQTTRETNSNEKLIGLELLKRYQHKNVVELGCGLGYYTKKISSVVESCLGVDISETAISKAKTMHPNCNFIVSDILNKDLYQNVDCILMVEITWYVLQKLQQFKNILAVHKGVGFFHTLNTYPENTQKYGTEYFTNSKEIMSFFSDVIDIQESGVFSKKENNGCSRTFFYGRIKG